MKPQRIIDLACFALFVVASFMPSMRIPVLGGISLVDDPGTAIIIAIAAVLGIYGTISDGERCREAGRRLAIYLVGIQFIIVVVSKISASSKIDEIENGIAKAGLLLILKSSGFAWGFSFLFLAAIGLLLSEAVAINLFSDKEAERHKNYRSVRRQMSIFSPRVILACGIVVLAGGLITISTSEYLRKKEVERDFLETQAILYNRPSVACQSENLEGSPSRRWVLKPGFDNVYMCGDNRPRHAISNSSKLDYDLAIWYEGTHDFVRRKYFFISNAKGVNTLNMLGAHMVELFQDPSTSRISSISFDKNLKSTTPRGHKVSIRKLPEYGEDAWIAEVIFKENVPLD